MATLPKCCKDEANEYKNDGMSAGKAMMKAIANHKAGKHDADGDDDGDGDEE